MISYLAFTLISFSVGVHLSNKPLANQPVSLFVFSEAGQGSTTYDAKTNASGLATFNPKEKASAMYVARTIYEGLNYFSEPIKFGATKPTVIKVFKGAAAISSVKIEDMRYYIEWRDELLFVEQTILVRNPSNLTLLGTGDEKVTFKFNIPSNAFNLRLLRGFEEDDTIFHGQEISSTRPIMPGLSEYAWHYEIEKPARTTALPTEISLPIDHVSIGIASPSLKIEGLKAQSEGEKYFDGRMVRTFSAIGVQSPVKLSISGIPLRLDLAKVLPIVFALALLTIFFLINKSSPQELVQVDRNLLLKQLNHHKNLKERGLITDTQYQGERLRLLELLAPHYKVADERHSNLKTHSS